MAGGCEDGEDETKVVGMDLSYGLPTVEKSAKELRDPLTVAS